MAFTRSFPAVIQLLMLWFVVASCSSAQTVVTCSSDNGRRNFCAADTRGGVQLIKQRSGSVCRQNYSWGYDRRGIWVDRGCRADFSIRSAGFVGVQNLELSLSRVARSNSNHE